MESSPYILPLGIKSNGILIDRAFKEAIPHQYNRELVQNAIEAGATEIKIQPEWVHIKYCQTQAVPLIYRYCISDNGKGMSPLELESYFNNISSSGHNLEDGFNFGVGAKISMLPWNKGGLWVMSWTKENPKGAWIKIINQDGNYGLELQKDALGVLQKVFTPPQEYKTHYLGSSETGTIVIGLGDADNRDSFTGPKYSNDEFHVWTHLKSLQTRYFNIPDNVKIKVAVLQHTDKAHWPTHSASGIENGFMWAHCKSSKSLLDSNCEQNGSLKISDATVYWWITNPEKSVLLSSLSQQTFIGAIAQSELYNTSSVKNARARYTQFGILFEEAKKRLIFLVEPIAKEYYPNTSRSGLLYEKGEAFELPWTRWGSEFAQKMPKEIEELCAKFMNGSKSDEKSIKDILKDFLMRLHPGYANGTGDLAPIKTALGGVQFSGLDGNSSDKVKEKTVQKKASKGKEEDSAKKINPRVEPPICIWVPKEEMENEAMAAEYVSAKKTVKINSDFYLFSDVIKHWISKYPDLPALEEKIISSVRSVYQLKLVSVIMQAHHMAMQKTWQSTWRAFLTTEALTASILGLIIEESKIQSAINGLGVKRVR